MQATMPMGLTCRREVGQAWGGAKADRPEQEVSVDVVVGPPATQVGAMKGKDKSRPDCNEGACNANLAAGHSKEAIKQKEKTNKLAVREKKKKSAARARTLRQILVGGPEDGPPNFMNMLQRWRQGLLRKAHMRRQRGASACVEELAANGLARGLEGFDDVEVLASGTFGVIRTGISKITKMKVAIKTVLPGTEPLIVVRELIAYAIVGNHKHIIDVLCMSDIYGSEGLVMEAALCDLHSAVIGSSQITFSLAQVISFEADATVGLAYMHKKGIVHLDQKLANTLVCSSPDKPSGFIGKVVDLGLCCGIGETKCVRMGTVSHAPPEGFNAEVAASTLDDTFAVGADLSFMLADKRIWLDDDNMWTHTSLLTSDEKKTLTRLDIDGGDKDAFLFDVTHRTMTDGSFARIMLQPSNFNKDLPPGELKNVCQFIRAATSVVPVDRPPMAAVTIFLRGLAESTAARLAPPTNPPAVEGGGAGLAARVEPAGLEELKEDGGAGLAAEVEQPRLDGGGGERIDGGGEEAVNPVVAPLQEMTRIHGREGLWTPGRVTGGGIFLLTPARVAVELEAFEVVARMRAMHFPFDTHQNMVGGGGGQEAAVPSITPRLESAGIDACGRLWAPVHGTGGGTPC